jgi:hypothetical protein
MDASLQEIVDAISTLEFEEYGLLAITSASWVDRDVTLCVTIKQQGHEDQRWSVLCRDVRHGRIANDETDRGFKVTAEHPLLLPYTEPRVELYFSSRPSDPEAAIGRLVEAHRAVMGDWFDCFRFFNLGRNGSLLALLDCGFGKVADGPLSLIDRYSEALRSSGVAVSSPPSRPPVWWNGTAWTQETGPLFALIVGSSYVISPTVTAKRE